MTGPVWWAPEPKDPADVVDYVFDFAPFTNDRQDAFSDFLGAGETITAATVTADPGVTVDSSGITGSSTAVTVWLSGGTHGADYVVACTVTTSAGRTKRRRLGVRVRRS